MRFVRKVLHPGPGRRAGAVRIAAAAVAIVATATPIVAQQSPLERKAEAVRQMLADGNPKADTLFTQSFLSQVPPARLQAINEQIRGMYGRPTSMRLGEKKSEYSAQFLFTTDRTTRCRWTS